jgi:uncharacterized protein (TIGR00297 family)
MDWMIGFGLSIGIAGLAYLKKSLTLSGMVAALFFGTLIYVFGQFLVWSALIAFFISSSLLTKLHEKKDQEGINVDKKGRNYIQVISNALVATIFLIIYTQSNQAIFLIASVVSIATSNADTWASEIGILSKGKTFSILNFKIMEKGSSGAVSVLGLLASALGAFFIGLIFTIVYAVVVEFNIILLLTYGMIITFGGFLGAVLDSYLGLLIQAKYKGEKTGFLSEIKKIPGEQAILISGLTFITNDAVNLLSGLFSSIVTILLFAV